MKNFLSLLCLLCISFLPGYAQKITFTPQWTPQSQFAGYYAALENGYYAEAGLDVSIYIKILLMMMKNQSFPQAIFKKSGKATIYISIHIFWFSNNKGLI